MTEDEKKLLQARHRLEEAQARDRVKERKVRTRRLIQEGAVLEKVFPAVTGMDLTELEDVFASIFLNGSGAFRETGALRFFFIPKGALTHHRPRAGGGTAALQQSCALRGGLRSLRRTPDNAAETAVPVIIVCAEGSLRRFLRLRKPATGSFVAEAGTDMLTAPAFSFAKEKQKDWR